jgi:glycosyltransferase involved in cell wall biosynthesis
MAEAAVACGAAAGGSVQRRRRNAHAFCHQTVASKFHHLRMNHPLPRTHVPVNFMPSRRSLRIALVTEPYPSGIQGAASSVARIIDGLRQRDHTVQLVRPTWGPLDRPPQRAGLEEVLTPAISLLPGGQLRVGLRSHQALSDLWSKCRPDLVHIATEGPLGWSAMRAAKALKLPVCSDFRSNFHFPQRFHGATWLQKPVMAYLRNFHNRGHCTMVASDTLRRQLSAEGFSRISIVSRGADTHLFSPRKRNPALRAQWGLDDDGVAVLYAGGMAEGGMAEGENHAAAWQAFQHLRSRQPAARLVVLGDWSGRKALQAWWPQAVFAGQRIAHDLAMCYASGDLLLCPAVHGKPGAVIAEAMASGLAIVAFDETTDSPVAYGHNRMPPAPGGVTAFAQRAADLACDARKRAGIGERARRDALELGWDGLVLRMEDLYAATMATANATPLPRVWAQARRVG